jgi:ascorbate-specific PTS system EIIC-type component UlaA
MIPTVIVMRKKVIIGTILLLVGAMVMVCGIIGAGNVVEKTYKTYSDTDPYSTEYAQQFYEFLMAGGPDKDPTPPLIDPVIILGTIVAAFGVVFLVKSKDKDFLPGI